MRIQAAVLRERGGAFKIEDVELAEPGPGEVLVEIAGTGFCHTDLLPRIDGFMAEPPLILGHEGVGVLAATGTSTAIYGAGTAGLSAVMAAAAAEAEYVIAVDRHRSRLDLALELGATHVADSTGLPGGEIANQVKGIAKGGTDTALDTTGAPSVVAAAVAALRAQGTLGLVAAVAGLIELPGDALATGKTVTGILEGDAVPRALIPELIDLWRQGRLPFDRLIRTYPMSDINQAEADMASGHTIKAILIPGATT
jgi:aryl-alcohol dehydrogenase